ncbi:MAG TPA: hypothetical protein VG073_05920 [Gaiellaceae bacterium]|nr:hypothetical protein [Gaiellaceae bacterium]
MNLGPGIELADAAFVALVVRAAQSVEGVRIRRPRKLELDGARLELALAARLGPVLPELARDVQARVHEAVETMCGIRLAGVDVTIEVLDT